MVHPHLGVLVIEVVEVAAAEVAAIIEVGLMGVMASIVMAEAVVSMVVEVELMMEVEMKEGTEVVILMVVTKEEKIVGTVRFPHPRHPHLVVLVALIHHLTMLEVQTMGLMQFLLLQATVELHILQPMVVLLVAMVVII